MFSVFSKRKEIVGLDLGSATVKVLGLSKRAEQFQLDSYVIVPLKEDSIVEKSIKQVEAVTEALTQAFDLVKVKGKEGALAMPTSLVITKIISMENGLKPADLESQIQLDANRYIPYPLEEVSLDFEVLGTNAKDETKVDILLAASRTEQVDARVDVVQDAGLPIHIVDVESYAIERALPLIASQLANRGLSKVIAVFNIGGAVTSVTVFDSLSIIYTREEHFGGKQLTDMIRSSYEINYDQAEFGKREGGLPADYQDTVLSNFKDSVATQISNSLQYFYSASDTEIDQIVLAGGTAAIKGLAEAVQERNKIPTCIADPFIDMKISSKINAEALRKDSPALLIACGLAMRGFDK